MKHMSMFPFILGKHLEVELLNHKVSIHNFRETACTVSKVVKTFPPTHYENSNGCLANRKGVQ